jgi:hypothetical protein
MDNTLIVQVQHIGKQLFIEVLTADKQSRIFFAEIKADGIYATTYGSEPQCIDTLIGSEDRITVALSA